ncbi:hypothetical protein [Actinacidiphila paucisporea]|uniref:Uncharacterized protein n=1 Tax=Actinacidiphila paucisporea TaxID=310782 RepID=A0A1M7QV15_9ACTN|nr:hypothetical protein [Actinacidiphila paucisporea]SHN35733.1 hypothetical protein SAMN05216499_14416 [Actinacidiphila paucisporea]
MNKHLRRAVLMSAVMASPAVLLPTAAYASTTPAVPLVGLDVPGAGVTVGGPTVPIDVSVDQATGADAFLRILFVGAAQNLRVSDDSGTDLPIVPIAGMPNEATIDIGAADTDGDGIPGAPLVNGTTHLHVAAIGHSDHAVEDIFQLNAAAVDGATGQPIGHSQPKTADLRSFEPFTKTSYGPAGSGSSQFTGASIVGGPETTTLVLSSRAEPSFTRMVFPADQLAAAGYTPAQFAAAVQVSFFLNDGPLTVLPWSTQDDGSLVLQTPVSATPAPNASDKFEQLRFHTPWDFPAGRLTTQLFRLAPDNTVLGADTQTLQFERGRVPITYHPLAATRVLDTRNRIGVTGTTAIAPGATLALNLAGTHGVAANATAVVLNVTATAPSAPGVLSVHAHGWLVGAGSNLNWTRGQTIANQVVVPLQNGKADFVNHSNGTVHIVADLQGYYAATTPLASGYTATTPTRILDTRNRVGTPLTTPVPAGGSVILTVPGLDPHTTAVTLNLTATGPTAAGFATVYPHGHTEPTASSLNWTRGQTIANLVTVPVTDGRIVLHNHSSGAVHLIADLQGTYTTDPDAPDFIPTEPTRLLDTRNHTGVTTTTPLAPGASVTLPVSRLGFDDATQTLRPLTAIVLNLTATAPTASGFLSAHPTGATTNASNLNWTRGQTIPNLAVTPVTNGTITLTNHSTGTVHLIADAYGYFTH